MERSPRLTGPRPRAAAVVAALLAALATLPWVVRSGPTWFYHIDFDVYREGGRAFLEGGDLYTRLYQVGGIGLPFTYPPLAAMLFAPLSWLPLGIGSALLTVASAVLLWWCITVVVRHCLPEWSDADHRTIATWVLPVALLAEPVRETLSFGQINIILMALVLADVLGRETRLPRGVLIGLAAAIKLTPAVFVLVFLVNRQWRAAAVTVASAVGLTLAAALVSPGNSLTYWLDTLSDPSRIGGLAYAGNQSLRGLLARLAEPGHEASGLLWLVLVAATLGAIIAAMILVDRTARANGVSGDLGLVLLASLVALLCSPVSWSHHWTWLIPLALALWSSAIRATRGVYRRTGVALAAGVTFIMLSGPHWLVPGQDNAEQYWPWWAQPMGNAFLLVAVLVLVTALLMPRILVPTGVDRHAPTATQRAWSWMVVVALASVVGSLLIRMVTGPL